MRKTYNVFILRLRQSDIFGNSKKYMLEETDIEGDSEAECLNKVAKDEKIGIQDFVILPVYYKSFTDENETLHDHKGGRDQQGMECQMV